MTLGPTSAVIRHELRVLRRDIVPVLVLSIMPIVIAAFLKPMLKAADPALRPGDNGAASAVSAMMVMFGFFLTGTVGTSFFHEHRWNTWERLRAESISTAEFVLGKSIPYVLLVSLYQVLVIAIGVAVLGLRIEGSLLLLFLTMMSFAMMLVAFAFALVAVCTTVRQLTAYSNLTTLLLVGLGGALTPIALLPGWVQAIGPWMPTYWLLRSFRGVFLDRDATPAALRCIGVLLLVTGILTVIALARFRVSDRKVYAA